MHVYLGHSKGWLVNAFSNDNHESWSTEQAIVPLSRPAALRYPQVYVIPGLVFGGLRPPSPAANLGGGCPSQETGHLPVTSPKYTRPS